MIGFVGTNVVTDSRKHYITASLNSLGQPKTMFRNEQDH